MKLKYKFFLIFSLISIIPLIIITMFSYERYKQRTYQQIDEISANIFSNAVDQANQTIDEIEQIAGIFTFYSDSENSIIQNLKQYSGKDANYDSYDILKSNQNIKFICQNILYTYDYIYGLYVFTPSGVILGYNNGQNGYILYDYDPKNTDWYKKTAERNGKMYISDISAHDFFIGNTKSLFFSKSLYDVYTHEFLGTLVIDCNPALFNLSSSNTMPEISVLTIENTENHQLLYNSVDGGTKKDTFKNLKMMTSLLNMDVLSLEAKFDYSGLFQEYNYTGALIVLIAFVCAVIAIILSFVLSAYLTEPIAHLSRKMTRQNGSHLTVSGRYLERTDEIGILYNEYNSMIEELHKSIQRDYKNKLISLDSQMKSLEAQINSHFLFNTLESINSLAEIEGSERIATMALALGNMFRYTIKTKSELVTIQEELNHVNDYISIQTIRFDNRFHLKVSIPEEMLTMSVLKLILQPIVENALYHGLDYCYKGDLIEIQGFCDNQSIYLSVKDNGQGMNAEQIEQLQNALKEEATFTELGHRNKQSIGLKNINTRIELYYGKGYGLTIQSAENQGSIIMIKLPILRKEGPECTPI